MNTVQTDTTLAFPLDEKTRRRLVSRWTLPLFMSAKLPLGCIAGLRIDQLNEQSCAVSLPFGWRTQNPFRSIYFAALTMAGEMSSGALGILACESAPSSVAMLVVNLSAEFTKKADQRTTFTCNDGLQIFSAVAHTHETGEPVRVTAHSVGTMPDGTEVAQMDFTWSFKRRSNQAR